MGVSSSNTSAQGARNGDSQIIPQGQTSGCYGNDPYIETKQGKPDVGAAKPLKP
jgi:hypothetical protein